MVGKQIRVLEEHPGVRFLTTFTQTLHFIFQPAYPIIQFEEILSLGVIYPCKDLSPRVAISPAIVAYIVPFGFCKPDVRHRHSRLLLIRDPFFAFHSAASIALIAAPPTLAVFVGNASAIGLIRNHAA